MPGWRTCDLTGGWQGALQRPLRWGGLMATVMTLYFGMVPGDCFSSKSSLNRGPLCHGPLALWHSRFELTLRLDVRVCCSELRCVALDLSLRSGKRKE